MFRSGKIQETEHKGILVQVPKGMPFVLAERRHGIPGIDANQFRPRIWLLLNEAFTCFQHQEYHGCMSALASAIELWILDEFAKKGFGSGEKLQKAIDEAARVQLITKEEAELFHKIRSFRNAYIHSKDEPWLVPRKIVKLTPQPGRNISQEYLQSTPSKDTVALMTAPPVAYSYLTQTIGTFRQRYPSNGAYDYLVAILVKPGSKKSEAKENKPA